MQGLVLISLDKYYSLPPLLNLETSKLEMSALCVASHLPKSIIDNDYVWLVSVNV